MYETKVEEMDRALERQLVEDVKKGDRTAMKRLYVEYAPRLFPVCRRYVMTREDAEDVLQETFVNIFRNIASFHYEGPERLAGWMRRIAVNKSITWLRKHKRLTAVALDENVQGYSQEPDYGNIPPKEILGAVASLPDGYRTVLNLYVFEGMSHREISHIMGISEGASAVQLHRARTLLWEKLNDESHER